MTLVAHPTLVNETYGVRTGKMCSLKVAINKLEIALGKNINVDFGSKQYKEREVMKPCQVYKYLTNWTPKVSLEEGFLRFLNQ